MNFINLLSSAVFCAILCVFLKSFSEQYTMFVSCLVCIGLLSAVIVMTLPLLDYIKELTEKTEFYPYCEIMIKACGIGLLTKLACDLCRDAGENAIGAKIELLGRSAILLLSFPVIKTLVGQAEVFLK